MPDIISIGECMVEFFAEGSLAEAMTFERAWGGDTANVLVAAARLGSSTGCITKLGNDPFATIILDALAGEGIDTSQVRVGSGFTGLYFISLLEDAAREFLYYRQGSAASTMAPDELNADFIAAAKFLHTSGITQALSASCRETTLAAARMAREKGVKVSYDPNFRSRLTRVTKAEAMFKEMIPFADIVLASSPEETGQLLSLPDPEQAVDYLAERGVPIIVVKMGPDGCLVARDGKTTRVEAHKIGYAVDTTGAGEAFDGAFLHCLATGATPVEAAEVAVVMAGLKCKGRGAVASMPNRADVESALGRSIP